MKADEGFLTLIDQRCAEMKRWNLFNKKGGGILKLKNKQKGRY